MQYIDVQMQWKVGKFTLKMNDFQFLISTIVVQNVYCNGRLNVFLELPKDTKVIQKENW